MKRPQLLVILFVLLSQIGVAQLGIGTTNVDPSAMLDVVSNNKGFLPPRIALSATNVTAPVVNPAIGLLVYNTATSGTDSNAVSPGYYYWNGTAWFSVSRKGKAIGDMQYWSGAQWTNLPAGANGSVLTMCNGVPRWGSCHDSIVFNSGSGGHAIYVTHNDSDPGWANSNVFTNTNVYRELAIAASTNGGATIVSRAYIAFDLSALPANATIISAKLSLYDLPSCNTIPQGNVGANNILIQRVTDNWNQTTITWNTQPPTTTIGQIELPPTTSTFNYNATGIDVTALVNDMRQQTPTKTGGFCLKLKTESIWRSVVFSSNRHDDVSKRPKLEIVFQ